MPSSTSCIVTRFIYFSLLLTFLFLSISSSAIRPLEDTLQSQDFMKQKWRPRQRGSSEFVLGHQRVDASALHDDHKTAYSSRQLVFNFLPKGSPIPPSGPSKRHNSVQN